VTDTIEFLNFINFFFFFFFSHSLSFFLAAYIRDIGFSVFYNFFLFFSLGQRIAFGGYRTHENSRPDTSFFFYMKLCVPLWFHRRKRLYPGPLLWFSLSLIHSPCIHVYIGFQVINLSLFFSFSFSSKEKMPFVWKEEKCNNF
jgi:hypothetical protein